METIYVDSGADAADYRIMQLAKRRFNRNPRLRSCFSRFSKGCIVLHHKGYKYTNDNIEQLLQTRYLSAMVRKSGKRTKGPKPFTAEDKEKFRVLFKSMIAQ